MQKKYGKWSPRILICSIHTTLGQSNDCLIIEWYAQIAHLHLWIKCNIQMEVLNWKDKSNCEISH